MKKFKVEKLSRQAQKEIVGGKLLTNCPRYTCFDKSTYYMMTGNCYVTSSNGFGCQGEMRNGLCCFF